MNKKNQTFWEDITDEYDSLVGVQGDKHHRLVINPIVSDLLGDLHNKVVLDAACGNGYISKKMASNAQKVYGVDFNRKFIDLARERHKGIGNLEFSVGNIMGLKFSDSFFDIVLCNMALINVENLSLAVKELSRVFKNGGSLVISITHPCFENPPHVYTLRDKSGGNKGKVITNYFYTGQVTNPENHHLHYHYMLSDYLNSFAESGLNLEKTVEPNGAEIMGSEEKDNTPLFLIIKLKKNK